VTTRYKMSIELHRTYELDETRVTVVMYDGSVATRPTDMHGPSPWRGVWLAAFLWEDYL